MDHHKYAGKLCAEDLDGQSRLKHIPVARPLAKGLIKTNVKHCHWKNIANRKGLSKYHDEPSLMELVAGKHQPQAKESGGGISTLSSRQITHGWWPQLLSPLIIRKSTDS